MLMARGQSTQVDILTAQPLKSGRGMYLFSGQLTVFAMTTQDKTAVVGDCILT
jgi:hypothetical protein